jgi:hypothetical protein
MQKLHSSCLDSRVCDVTGPPRFTGYLCPLDANVYGIEFLKFEIRDYDSGKAVYQVRRQQVTDQKECGKPQTLCLELIFSGRCH